MYVKQRSCANAELSLKVKVLNKLNEPSRSIITLRAFPTALISHYKQDLLHKVLEHYLHKFEENSTLVELP
jgi:hypothetical protein